MSFIETMYRKLDEGGNAPAIIEMRGKQAIATSAQQLKQLTARVRGYLEGKNIQPGDRVALIAHNGARWAAADLAILAAVASVPPIWFGTSRDAVE